MHPPEPPRTAAILVIGDEVLSGKTHDCNSHWLAGELYALGVALERVVVIPDLVAEIGRSVAALSEAHDVVFTSGGVGPTHDDLTYAGIARGFSRALVRNEALVERMRVHYRDTLNEARLRMADIPEPDELCFENGMVTPVVRVHNVYILPGVPVLFRQLFGGLRERFRRQAMYLGQLFTKQPEGDIADLMTCVVEAHPAVRVGSYPHLGDEAFRVKITVESTDESAARAALESIAAGLDPLALVERREVQRVLAPGSADC
ncbi:MAG: molybdopterin-binding protein [Pseudomonadota bacterium]